MAKTKTDPSESTPRALDELKHLGGFTTPGAPAPGAPVPFEGGVGRLHGRFGQMTWGGGSWMCYDWSVETTQEFADGTAHGDYWDIPVPLKQSWTGTARVYMTTVPPPGNYPSGEWTGWAGQYFLPYTGAKVSGDPAPATFVGWNHSPGSGPAIFIGTAWVSRSNFEANKSGPATQEIQLRGLGAPSAGVQP